MVMSASVFGTRVRVLTPLMAGFFAAVLVVLTEDPVFLAVDEEAIPRVGALRFSLAAGLAVAFGRADVLRAAGLLVVAALVGLLPADLRGGAVARFAAFGAAFFATLLLARVLAVATFDTAAFFAAGRLAVDALPGDFAAALCAAPRAAVPVLATLPFAAGFGVFFVDFARGGAAAFRVARPLVLSCAMTRHLVTWRAGVIA